MSEKTIPLTLPLFLWPGSLISGTDHTEACYGSPGKGKVRLEVRNLINIIIIFIIGSAVYNAFCLL